MQDGETPGVYCNLLLTGPFVRHGPIPKNTQALPSRVHVTLAARGRCTKKTRKFAGASWLNVMPTVFRLHPAAHSQVPSTIENTFYRLSGAGSRRKTAAREACLVSAPTCRRTSGGFASTGRRPDQRAGESWRFWWL